MNWLVSETERKRGLTAGELAERWRLVALLAMAMMLGMLIGVVATKWISDSRRYQRVPRPPPKNVAW